MANGQTPKTTKMQPIPQGTGNRRRRRGRKNKVQNKRPQQQKRSSVRRTARAVAKGEIKRLGLSGPKVAVSQTVTATLGTIGANQGDKVELELASLLNPALVKEQSGSNAFGPVQALAAQFGLWRCSQAHLSFTPLVGSSAVSGTAVRASLNLTSTPGSTSWSGLGARVHKDVMVGQHATFHLARKQLNGPRETWWLTNTNDDKTQSLGPTIEVHSLGKTTSTYQNTDYTGSLFLVELRATWEFSNYLTQPALATLVKEEAPAGTVTVDAATPGNPVTITVNDPATVARLSRVAPARSGAARAAGDVGETILQVVDTSVSVASGVLPPPFGWLLAGGWWFVKRLAGVTRAGTASFLVYASAEDAAANRPCIADGNSSEVVLPGVVHFNQINTPNTGVSSVPAVSLARSTLDPPAPGEPFNFWALVTQPAMKNSLSTYDQNLFFLVHEGAGTTTSEIMCFQVGEDTNYRHAINQAWIVTSPLALHNMQAVPIPTGYQTLRLRWNGQLKDANAVAWYSTVANSQPSGDHRVCQTFILWSGVNEGAFTAQDNTAAYTHSITGSGTTAKVTLQPIYSTGQLNCPVLNNAFLLTRSFGRTEGVGKRYTDGLHVLYGPDSQIPNGSYPNFHMGPSGFGKPYQVSMELWATRPDPFTLQSTPLSVGRSSDLHTDEYDVLEGRISVDTGSDTDYATDSDSTDSEPEDFVDWAFQMSAKYTTGDDSSAPLREKIGKLLVEEGVPAETAQRRAMLAAPTPAFQDFLHAHQEVLSDGFGSRRVIHSDLSDEAVNLGLSYFSSRGHAE